MQDRKMSMYKVAKAILKNDEDVADAMQDTILDCWEKIHTLRHAEYFKTWLIRILINNCNIIYNKNSKWTLDNEIPEEVVEDKGFANIEWIEMLNCLDEKQRVVVIGMEKLDDYIEAINKDMEIPDNVNQRFEETLSNLKEGRRPTLHILRIASCVAAVIVVLCSAFLFANPTVAAKIPIIGDIFARLKESVQYSGDISKEQTLILDSDKDENISDTDKGITITASEVYCDGISTYVTVKLESDIYDFSILERGPILRASYGINKEASIYDYDVQVSGKNDGKNSYIGIMVINKNEEALEKALEDGYIKIIVKEIDMFEYGDRIEGNWEITIPFIVDTSMKVINVDREVQNEIVIKSINISKYHGVMYYKTNEMDEFISVVIFNQDGERLESRGNVIDTETGIGTIGINTYNYDITKLHIYVMEEDVEDHFKWLEVKSEEEAKEFAIFDFVIDVK